MPVTVEVLGPAPVCRPRPGAGRTYRLAGSMAEVQSYLALARTDRVPFGADWEASSLNPALARPAGLSLSMADGDALYVPVGHLVDPAANLPVTEVVAALDAADRAGAPSLWFHVGYDHEVSAQSLGWEPQHWEDVLFAVMLVDPNVYELGLKASALRFLGVPMQELRDLDPDWVVLSAAAKARTPYRLPHHLPPATVAPYGCDDAAQTRRLWFHPPLQAAVRQQRGIYDLEKRLAPVLRRGLRHGVALDPQVLQRLLAEVTQTLATLTATIQSHLGDPPLALSRKTALAQRLLDLGLPIHARTPTGLPTVNVKVLDQYRDAHPVIPLLQTYARLEAQGRNYLQKLLAAHQYFATQPWAHGMVRFAFSQVGVPTGRMKCGGAGKGPAAYRAGVADVNAQSIPDKDKAPDLPNIRSAFVAPRPDFVVVSLDYNQVELRLLANVSLEPRWIQAFHDGTDLHLANAQAIADQQEPGLRVTPADKLRRGRAKATGFALSYGGAASTVARQTGLALDAADHLVTAFFAAHPRLKAWMRHHATMAATTQQATTPFGRVRPLHGFFTPEPPRPPKGTPKEDPRALRYSRWWRLKSQGEREAINTPIQGGAADVFKYACSTRLAPLLDQFGPGICSPQVLWLHDEVVFYCHRDWVQTVVPQARLALQYQHPTWPVPLTADAEIGDSWGTLVPYAQWVQAQQAPPACPGVGPPHPA